MLASKTVHQICYLHSTRIKVLSKMDFNIDFFSQNFREATSKKSNRLATSE